MRKKIPVVIEEQKQLKILLKKASKPWMRQRIEMLLLLKNKQARTILELSEILDVNRNTIGRWISMYEEGSISGLLEMKKPKGRKLSLEKEQLVKLEEKLSEKGFFSSYRDIEKWLKEDQGVEIPYKTVHKIVRYKLNWKVKKQRKPVIKTTKFVKEISKNNVVG